ncbi:uncharacterized protein V1510DRAFT_347720, partial [Dipodascopsis tothii]|uniref:uncharacterized protein n=1 Tax=Dipodascopsis tothii TaxID=44089 RepID=UPI0034CFFE2F
LREQLQDALDKRDEYEKQYKNLLSKVSGIRDALGDRLKTNSEEIARQKTTIEYLEKKNKQLTETVTSLQQEVLTASEESDKMSHELASLRQMSISSQGSWYKERDALVASERRLKDKLAEADKSAQDWELIATEERTLRENSSRRIFELEEHINGQKDMVRVAHEERDAQTARARELETQLAGAAEEREREREELEQRLKTEVVALETQVAAAQADRDAAQARLATVEADLERCRPYEAEVKEKSLLIGKLRHEAVILNEHLTKALRLLKRGSPEDNVDRQLITNLLLSFLALPRSDTKRFEVLQLIAACLSWNEEQKVAAGLIRGG